jgi:succinate dehydrogenase / fumarate reductase cytochrome b subunit
MNAVAICWPEAYNVICRLLGANWYALVASAGLGLLFVIHIIYALWLTIQNRRARGNDRYAVTARQPQVEWSSKNMLVLGIVVVAFMIVHLIQFWAKMQLVELLGCGPDSWAQVNGAPASPELGTLFIQAAFSSWWTPVVYIIGFVALWFHFNHGFWSMFQTVGWNNTVWINRLKKISCWWTSIVVALFIIEAVVFTVQASNDAYLTNPKLQEQYIESWNEKISETIDETLAKASELQNNPDQQAAMAEMENLEKELGEKVNSYAASMEALVPGSLEKTLMSGNLEPLKLNFIRDAYMRIHQPQMGQQPNGDMPAPAADDEYQFLDEDNQAEQANDSVNE